MLSEIACAAGLAPDAVAAALAEPALAEEVARVDQGLRDAGIGGVPFFVVNGRVGVNGAQGELALRRAFERAAGMEPAAFALGA